MSDIVIRNGTVVDGTGGDPFEADVSIESGRITAVGKVSERGVEEIDARDRSSRRGLLIRTLIMTRRRRGAARLRRRRGMASPRR